MGLLLDSRETKSNDHPPPIHCTSHHNPWRRPTTLSHLAAVTAGSFEESVSIECDPFTTASVDVGVVSGVSGRSVSVRLEVRFATHQSSYVVTGTLIRYSETVEFFSRDGKPVPMAVPCVILDCGDQLKVVPLQRSMYEVSVTVLDRE